MNKTEIKEKIFDLYQIKDRIDLNHKLLALIFDEALDDILLGKITIDKRTPQNEEEIIKCVIEKTVAELTSLGAFKEVIAETFKNDNVKIVYKGINF
jgi:hypothetical protein